MEKQFVVIIPARGGSKRIPRKNIKNFFGKPIISYSIETALKINCFDEVMVSTEDIEIANISKKYGAKVPFIRSVKNSNDFAMLSDVIEEVLLSYKNLGVNFTNFCCILPTSPFVNSKTLYKGYKKFIKSNADALVPVSRFSYPIQRAVKIEQGKICMFNPENYNIRSQDLKPAYHDVGQFYFMKSESLFKYKKLYVDNTIPIIIPELEVQDIDSLEDWEVAEMKYEFLMNREKRKVSC